MTDKSSNASFIYGPVPSRRLGRSLGVDLVPLKLCTYDCVYCQLGKSSSKTVKRLPYRNADTVLAQLFERLKKIDRPDRITIAGSGEPTLNSGIGAVIAGIKKKTDIPVVVLTNGSLLSNPEVQKDLLPADMVIPSLDAWNPEMFASINRPHRSVDFTTMTEGLVSFSTVYGGQLWLEIFIMDGINASVDDARAFKPLVDRINPAVVYVNTAVRPPEESFVKQAPPALIDAFYRTLGRAHQKDVVFDGTGPAEGSGNVAADIVEMVARRPVTATDIAAGLNLPEAAVGPHIEQLVAEGRLEAVPKGDRVYFRKP
ncbi:MAG: radical SAM protein [Thermodesulfobacteriota bacterium]|nr:radical SAM protein [Thermodesulfobacteriota bacterium]